MSKSKGKDPLEGLGGPMTRARARKAKEALHQVLSILFVYKPKFQGEKSKVVSCIMAQMEEGMAEKHATTSFAAILPMKENIRITSWIGKGICCEATSTLLLLQN